MKVVILCGGLGTRLREETEFRPKPMVNIGNRPILCHIMKTYAAYGHKDFILALGYKGEMIKNYFCHYELMNNDFTIELGHTEKIHFHQGHKENDWRITLADTGEKTLKGGRLKRVEQYIDGDYFFMTYGDGVANLDVNDLLDFHLKHGKLVTVTGVNPASRFGELKVAGEEVKAFSEKPESDSQLVNGGFFVFNKRIFDYLSAAENCDLENDTLERIAHEGQMMVYRHTGFWACMDTIRDMDYLNNLWNENKADWKIW